MKLWIRAEVLRLTNIRASQNRKVGDPGPEGSIGKMAIGRAEQGHLLDSPSTCWAPTGMLYGGYPMIRPETAMSSDDDSRRRSCACRANSIEGGTTEVMKNILGERVLGLPGDVRVDRDCPGARCRATDRRGLEPRRLAAPVGTIDWLRQPNGRRPDRSRRRADSQPVVQRRLQLVAASRRSPAPSRPACLAVELHDAELTGTDVVVRRRPMPGSVGIAVGADPVRSLRPAPSAAVVDAATGRSTSCVT